MTVEKSTLDKMPVDKWQQTNDDRKITLDKMARQNAT